MNIIANAAEVVNLSPIFNFMKLLNAKNSINFFIFLLLKCLIEKMRLYYARSKNL